MNHLSGNHLRGNAELLGRSVSQDGRVVCKIGVIRRLCKEHRVIIKWTKRDIAAKSERTWTIPK